jgi:hypothetical protein
MLLYRIIIRSIIVFVDNTSNASVTFWYMLSIWACSFCTPRDPIIDLRLQMVVSIRQHLLENEFNRSGCYGWVLYVSVKLCEVRQVIASRTPLRNPHPGVEHFFPLYLHH